MGESHSHDGGEPVKIDIFQDSAATTHKAAKVIAASARDAVVARGKFVFAVSGGRTPWQMLRDLTREDVPWKQVHLFQVDERVAPAGDHDRNLTHLQESLLSSVPLPKEQVQAMPVEAPDLETGAAQYVSMLQKVAGRPPVLDLVHLGLGPDGHTASLTPGDPVLDVADRDVATTGAYQGRRRMTLTYPILDRARRILWLVTGSDKRDALRRLREGDRSIPAGRVSHVNAVLLADRAAADAP
jgi:6-phosphogluconolactonase